MLTRVAQGLLGLSRKMSLVYSVTAAAMASRSCSISRSGITTLVPPRTCTNFWYMRKEGWLVTTSSPDRTKALTRNSITSLEPLPRMISSGAAPVQSARALVR
ncbi:hypothetical protein H206_05498 [Candidatus Electrothrix aarhusensis]|uniref:Uncharacterized protein n=1 Tax=Candidatus Electrothrix aarhusensis TaxID=1859131 RepID=A0A444J485_9BACT|nr:hypothetical protein H206_05498 [Candidatus Electrothrix aarhusensis]